MVYQKVCHDYPKKQGDGETHRGKLAEAVTAPWSNTYQMGLYLIDAGLINVEKRGQV